MKFPRWLTILPMIQRSASSQHNVQSCVTACLGDIQRAMSADVAVYWVLALPAVAAFYLAYGVVEKIIRKWRTPQKITEPTPHISKPSTVEPPRKDDLPPAAHGYDTPELFRRDALIHIRQLAQTQVCECPHPCVVCRTYVERGRV